MKPPASYCLSASILPPKWLWPFGYGTSGGFLRWLAQRWWQWIFCFLCVAGFSLSWIIGRVLTHLIGARLKWEVGSWRCRVFRLFMNSFFSMWEAYWGKRLVSADMVGGQSITHLNVSTRGCPAKCCAVIRSLHLVMVLVVGGWCVFQVL